MNIFWISDPTVLYKNQKYLDFFPTSKMTRIEQLNSITRFCIYFLLIAIITEKSELWIQIPIVIIIFIVILYYIFEYDTKGMSEELYRLKGISNNNEPFNENSDNEIEAGYYDSNGELHVGKYLGRNGKNKQKIKYSFEDYKQYKKSTCRVPTKDNPFMNPTSNDFEIEDPPEACNVDDDDIKEKMTECFNDGLFMDVGDLFERENSQRQFFTVPQMNPPDQTAFANWLYKTDDICKVDQTKCLRYEDLRYKKGFSTQQGQI